MLAYVTVEKLLLPEEVAEIARVDVQTVRRWLREGQLKGQKVGRGWRVKESDLKQFLEGNEKQLPANDDK